MRVVRLSHVENHYTNITSCDGMTDKVVYINGFSKMFAMTGLGPGYAVGLNITKNMAKFIENGKGCLSAPGRWSSTSGLFSCIEKIEEMILSCLRSRDLICSLIDEMHDLSIRKPGGDFYAFTNTKSFVMHPG